MPWEWVNDLSIVDEQQLYLVCSVYPGGRVYQPQLLLGWQVKQRLQGCYVATPFYPPSFSQEPS